MKKIGNGLLVLILIGIYIYASRIDFGGQAFVNDDDSAYIRGKVLEVEEEEVQEYQDGLYTGYQKLLVHDIKNDRDIEVENNLSTEHSILAKEGTGVIVAANEPQGVDPFYAVYNYDRGPFYSLFLVCFLLLLYLVGRKKGLMSFLALASSIYIVIFFMMPMIYQGSSVVLITLLTCILCSLYSMIILYGYSFLSLVNLLSISLGYLISAILYLAVSKSLHLSGYNIGDVEGLLLISQDTGMDIGGILYSTVAVSSLGASMDMAVSVSSPLLEIRRLNQNSSPKDLFKSGMNIGKDLIGTMVNTLIFSFLGGGLTSILIFISYGVDFNQLINSDFFAIELLTGLISSSVIVLLVPVTSYLSGLLFTKKGKGV